MQHRWSCRTGEVAAQSSADRGEHADQGCGRYDSWHDPITGLPRPTSFLEHLERLCATPARPLRSVAMLLLEITDYDILKAQLGEAWCDELLRTIAEGLHDEVPEPNLVTRLRAGEFAIVLRDLGPEVTPEVLATHLLDRASEPCPSGDRLLRWAVVGALAAPDDRAETAMQLFDRATRALARAKLHSAAQPLAT